MFDGLPGYGMVANGMDAQSPQDGLLTPKNLGLLGLIAGLAKASGPSRLPQSFGQVVGEGLLGGVGAYQQGAQIQRQDTQDKLLNVKLGKEIGALDALQKFGQPTNTAAGSMPQVGVSDSSAAAIGAPWAASSQIQQPQAAPQSSQVPDFGGLIKAGVPPEAVKALMEDYKLRNPDLTFQGGIALNPRTGLPVGAPAIPQTNQQGFSTFLKFNPKSGQYEVNLTPGGSNAFETQQGIAEGTKARYDPFMGVLDKSGRPIPMTRGQFADTYDPRQGQTPATKSPPPDGGNPPPIVPTGFAATEADALKRVQDATDRGETATITVDPSKAGGMGMTHGEQSFSEVNAKNAGAYRSALNERVSSGQDLMMRVGESERLLKDFQAGGGEGVRVQLAQAAQAVGAPQGIVDGIARGNLGSAQAFQKIVVSQAMEALKQAMSTSSGTGAGRITQAEFKIFQSANPNLELDPRALEKIYGFARSVHDRDFNEQQTFQKWLEDGKDPANFQATYSRELEQKLKTDRLKNLGHSQNTAPQQGVLRYNPRTGKIE